MKTLFCAAAVAAMALSSGVAFAEGGGGGDGGVFGQPYEAAPSGFYSMNPTAQAQQEMQAYVINQERNWQVAHARSTNPPVAQSTTPSNG